MAEKAEKNTVDFTLRVPKHINEDILREAGYKGLTKHSYVLLAIQEKLKRDKKEVKN